MAVKIWLKAPDPQGNCCNCDGKTSPCDSCCALQMPTTYLDSPKTVYSSKTAAQTAINNQVKNCLLEMAPNDSIWNIPAGNRLSVSAIKGTNSLIVNESLIDSKFSYDPNMCGSQTSITYTSSYNYGGAGVITLAYTLTVGAQLDDGSTSVIISTLTGTGDSVSNPITDIYLIRVGDSTNHKYRQGDSFNVAGCTYLQHGQNFFIFAVGSHGTYDMAEPYTKPAPVLVVPANGISDTLSDYFLAKATIQAGTKVNSKFEITASRATSILAIVSLINEIDGTTYTHMINLPPGLSVMDSLDLTISKTGNYFISYITSYNCQNTKSALSISFKSTLTASNKDTQQCFSPCGVTALYVDTDLSQKILTCQ